MKNSGLTVATPYIIFQDRSGQFWIGGSTGVNRYDEERGLWSSFKENSDLSGSTIQLIGQSDDGKLWFASGVILDLRLICFDGHHFVTMNAQSPNSILKDSVYGVSAMVSSRDGKLWVAIKDTLFGYHVSGWMPLLNVSRITGVDLHPVVAIAQDSEGHFWIGGRDSVLRLSDSGSRWKEYSKPAGLSGISRINVDRAGALWFGGDNGHVAVFEKDSWQNYNLVDYAPAPQGKARADPLNTSLGVRAIYHDKSRWVMFGTRAGLALFSKERGSWEWLTAGNSGLPDSSITAIVEDRVGRIWIGTGNGIVVLEQ